MSPATDPLAPAGLTLDERQRAMLAEMRIPFWWPEPLGAPEVLADAIEKVAENDLPTLASAPRQAENPVAPPPPRPVAAPAMARPAPRPAAAVATTGWAVQAPVALYGSPAGPGGWLVLTEAVWAGADPLADAAAGKLLDNMLRAMRLHQAPRVWLAGLARAEPGAEGGLDGPGLLARHQPGLVLLMGRAAARYALATEEPLGRLRGQVHDLHGVPAVVTYDAPYLLRAPADKGKAWSDLCLALDRMAGLGG